MFYCDDCAKESNYPTSIVKSSGLCEMCGKTKTQGLNPVTGVPERVMMTIQDEGADKKLYPVIKVPASGKPVWGGGARTMAFVYSRNMGNFILEGFHDEVEAYLKKNYTHYFVNYSLWWHGEHRDIWDFWKDSISIFHPTRKKRDWKIQVRPYSNYQTDKTELAKQTFKFKRLPKRWIPE